MGDPAGIGPEIIARCLADADLRASARFVVHGCGACLTLAQERCGVLSNWYRVDAAHDPTHRWLDDVVVLDDTSHGDLITLATEPTKRGGSASKQWVESAIADALLEPHAPRHVDAVVTGPISKQSWNMAGFKWLGHTELLAARTKSKRACMVFESPQLRVALATVHIPLMSLRDVLTIGCVFEPIDLGWQACQQLGITRPRIAVCGLNPHAGEDGLLGDEENRVIAPAISMAREQGIDAHGPFPADTIFRQAVGGRWDMVVAMYHDQGLIPLKLLGGGTAVNWTIGLPIIRTSPDHGTAFDIAGSSVANHDSMRSAISLAVQLAQRNATMAATTS